MSVFDARFFDVGEVLGTGAVTAAVAYGVGLLAFLGTYVLASGAAATEIVAIRRLIFATRVALALEILAAAVLLHLELAVSNALVWPGYGAARPVAAMLVGFVAWFVNSHPCFRWLAVGAHLTLALLDTMVFAASEVAIGCLRDGTCLKQSGWQLDDYLLLRYRTLVALALEAYVSLAAAALAASMGPCAARYSVRLFSSSRASHSFAQGARDRTA